MNKLLIPDSARIAWNTISDSVLERSDQESIFLATFDDISTNTKYKYQIDYSFYSRGKYEGKPKYILRVYSFGLDFENYSDTINYFDKEYDALADAINDINYWMAHFKDKMPLNMETHKTESYWTNRYNDQSTGWDIGYPSTPLKEYIDQLSDKRIRILIPGAGNAYEAEYLIAQGFTNTFVMDISPIPLQQFTERNPAFPKAQLLEQNFFEHKGKYDLILEQTFFCSFEPTIENRNNYAMHMNDLLNINGKLVGVWFDIPLVEGNMDKRPFGGTKDEYLSYIGKYFTTKTFESCHNSIAPRAGQELFGIFKKKQNGILFNTGYQYYF
jgi:methyl halide transferase